MQTSDITKLTLIRPRNYPKFIDADFEYFVLAFVSK